MSSAPQHASFALSQEMRDRHGFKAAFLRPRRLRPKPVVLEAKAKATK